MLRTLHVVKTNNDKGMWKLTLHIFVVETLESYSYTIAFVPGDRKNHGMEIARSYSGNAPMPCSLLSEVVDGETYAAYMREVITQHFMEDSGRMMDKKDVAEWKLCLQLTADDFSDDKWVRYDGDGMVKEESEEC